MDFKNQAENSRALSTTCGDLLGSDVKILIDKGSEGSETDGICKIIVFGLGCGDLTAQI